MVKTGALDAQQVGLVGQVSVTTGVEDSKQKCAEETEAARHGRHGKLKNLSPTYCDIGRYVH